MLTRETLLQVMDGLIDHQRKKVLQIARRINPQLTEEDLRNPHDFPDLYENQRFNFEDGILSGFISARVALLAELNRQD